MANVIYENPLTQCFAQNIPLLDFHLDDSPNFYHKLGVWSNKVREGFEIFSGVTDAYDSVCSATSNLHLAWEKMINVLDSSSEFMKKDDSFSPFSDVINSICDQMEEIQRYLKVRVDQMLDLTCSNLKKIAEEKYKIESLDLQLKRTQETYFNALDKFGNVQVHDKNLVEYGEAAMASRRNYFILILKCVFSLREIYSTGIIEFAKNVIQDSLIHFTYYTHASNVYKNSEEAIGEIDRQIRKAKIYCKKEIEADEKFHRLLREEVTNKFNFDSESIKKLSTHSQIPVKVNKFDISSALLGEDGTPIGIRITRLGSAGRIKNQIPEIDTKLKSPSHEDIHQISSRLNTSFSPNIFKEEKGVKKKALFNVRKRTNTTAVCIEPPVSSKDLQLHIPLSHSNSALTSIEDSLTSPNRGLGKRFVHKINKRISTIITKPGDSFLKSSANSLDSNIPSITNKNLLIDGIDLDEDGTKSLTGIQTSNSVEDIPSLSSPTKMHSLGRVNRCSTIVDYNNPPLDITRPYNVNPGALNKLPSIDGDFKQSEDYLKRLNPLHSYLKTGYLRQKPKGNFALRAPKWPLVYCVIDKEEGWLRAGEMNGLGLFPLQNLMLSTTKKADDVDKIHCFKVVSPELEVTLQAFTPNEYKQWIDGLEEAITYTIHNNHSVKWRSVKRPKGYLQLVRRIGMSLCPHKPKARGRCTQFGLEVPETVLWKNWEPGKEYTKNIPIKNVRVNTQHFHYSVPTLQVFSSNYPKPISLSSGTSHVIAVSFRPVERSVYSDKIVVRTEEGNLEIPIKATLPVPQIELVESVQFGMVAIADTSSMLFKIRNSSDVSIKFSFDVPEPFTISPKHGNLSPRKECQLTCTFTPNTASVYIANAVCFYEDCRRKLELLGTGKFAYIEIKSTNGKRTRDLNFKNVAMGQLQTQKIILSNESPVTAPFKVRPLWGQKGPISPFSCSDLTGRIGAFEKHELRVTFSPSTLTGVSIDYLTIECVGSHTETTVKCVGTAVNPVVALSAECIEFSSVPCNSEASKVIEINNTSPVATLFQFRNVEQTVFTVEPSSGKIAANSKRNLTVSFSPTDALPYHRRLVCLVHYQTPLFIDVLGAGTTDDINPVLLKQEHLSIYENRFLKGLASYPPEQLKLWIREEYISINGTETVISPNAPFLQETLDFKPKPVDKYSYEYIFTPDYMSQFILDTRDIDFGSAVPSTDHSTHKILATNLSKGVINCVWITPKGSVDTFMVSPRTHELSPGASYEFRITFSPCQLNKYYDTTIECYGYFKALKDYHLVTKECVSPSWCSTVKLSGHTWKKGGENSPSTLVWESKEIQFSPSLPNTNSYKTIILSNKSSVSVQFNFRQIDSDCFEIIPQLGLLSDENQIFILKMKSPPLSELPTKLPSLIYTTLICDINHDLNNPEKLMLCGTIESPRVVFPDGDCIFFHPCVVNGRVDQGLRVQNTSMLALQFDWSTQEAAPGITRIIPQKGTIQPNEIQTHTWVFTPTTEGRHSFRATVTTSFANWNSDQRHRESISIVGDSCKSELYVSNKQVNLGFITVRSNHKEYIPLINPCPCHLTYTLSYKAFYTGLNGDIETCGPKEVQLPADDSTITAGSTHSIALFLKPEHQGEYTIQVSYQIVTDKKQATATHSLFTVLASVCYPSVCVVDTKQCCVSGSVSKQRLWEMLSIDSLNALLIMEPSYDEMRYDIATRHSMKRRIPVLTRAIVDFNFGSAPINSPDSEIILLLENKSSVCVEYAFQFPNDMYLEPEYWADTGELDLFESKELYLMENAIFSVDNKSGTLAPGQRRAVRCSHKHRLVGESILPVLLKIRRGREVLLNFKGITSQLATPHVNFTSDTFYFRPIQVGLLLPPLQAYKLYNGGDADSSYELDTSPLTELVQLTNGLQVLECLNPTGRIPAYGYTELLFLFTPPEPVEYTVDMPLTFEGDTKLITFVAEGYTIDEGSRDNSVLLPSKQEIAKVPVKQLIHTETEIAVLSTNTISFNHLPLFSPARRITFLRNNSDRTLSFEWELPSERIAEVLTIKPQNGYLHPNQSISCQVVFLSMVDPSFYDVSVRCVVTDESSVLSYKIELAEWEKEQNEKQHMFTITSTQRGIKSHKKESLLVNRHNSLPPLEQNSYEDWIRKDLSKKSKHRPRKPKETESPKPTPPSPFSLELCVNARTHSIADYYTIFPDCQTPFIDTNEIISAMQPADTDMPINPSVSRLLTTMLASLIHSLINDTSFETCLSAIGREPIPYFSQFQQRPIEFESIAPIEEEQITETHKPTRVESAPIRLSGRQVEMNIPSREHLDRLKQQENISILLEGILENSIRCIIGEADTNEIDITAKSNQYTLASS